jgi:GAF domain-containing protein
VLLLALRLDEVNLAVREAEVLAVTQDPNSGGRGQPSAHDTGSMIGRDDLASTFSELARSLEQSDDPHLTLEQIVQAAVQLIPGVDEGSISVVSGRKHVTSQVPTGELARSVDMIQDEVKQGPCLDAAYEHETVRVPDLATETRWPEFSQRLNVKLRELAERLVTTGLFDP